MVTTHVFQSIIHYLSSIAHISTSSQLPLDVLSSSALVVLDANVPESTVTYTSSHCHTAGVPVWFEPTSVAKSLRGLPAFTNGHIMFLKPSTQELMAMSDAMGYPSSTADESFDALQGRLRFMLSSVNAPSFSSPVHIVLTRGSKGVVLASRSFSSSDANNISVTSFPVPPSQKVAVINTSGAGDSLVGAMVWHLTHRVNKPRTAHGYTHEQVTHSVPYGMSAATLSVQAPEAISTRITAPALDTLVHNC